jgi:hypothetical protein
VPEVRDGQPLDGSDLHQLRSAPARLNFRTVHRSIDRCRATSALYTRLS